ncbi:MAG TPA: nucleoside triphosphate pyrophosphohydrolase [Candidatus Angelobacter sp.]|nr:nucleoside triphosphate pyrophosphohydrolase [Candidatus Angelobacter sp.]
MSRTMRDEAAAQLRALNETVERLRAPGGCPWDREQTHRSLRQYLLEETYEVLEAIEKGGESTLREELGDVLLQVLMHSAIAAEREDGFDIGDVAEVTRTKMVHRHPHVFGDVAVSGADEVVVNWEKLKAREKGERLSVLEGVPRSLPALAFALGVQKRPARLGFDETPQLSDALAWTRRALEELEEAGERVAATAPAPAAAPAAPGGHSAGPPPAPPELEDAVGELLFAAVAAARRLRVNPEDALRRRATQFADRFATLEATARGETIDLHGIDADDWQRRWESTR